MEVTKNTDYNLGFDDGLAIAHAETAALRAEVERLREVAAPFAFLDMGRDEDEGVPFTTQEVWETVYRDRVQDWFSFEEIDALRQALKVQP